MLLRFWNVSAREATLAKQLADEEAAHEATRRKLKISEAEAESLAAVIARDRLRVQAEAAGFARARAESEGVTNNERRT